MGPAGPRLRTYRAFSAARAGPGIEVLAAIAGGRSPAMEWDPGPIGILTLLGMSTGFALIVQALTWRRTRRMWLIAALVYFAFGLFVSEVWFGWATEEDLQPNYDGLSFDEVLLLATLFSGTVVLGTWLYMRRAGRSSSAQLWNAKGSRG